MHPAASPESNAARPTPPPTTASTLAPALSAAREELIGHHGERMVYYAATTAPGRPLLLIHSINAAPSSYEVKPLFDHYRTERPVYSLDLPGFGLSERAPPAYSADRFADAIVACLDQLPGTPVDIVALSLSAEFAARAALTRPERVRSLVLISPTGFSARPLPSPRLGRRLHRVLRLPGLGSGLFRLLASRPSIRYFLDRSFTERAPDDLVDYAWASAHQPAAWHAPLVFLSMQLFTPDAIDTLYARLHPLPVLAIADRDPYVDFSALPEFAAAQPNWTYERLAPHLGLPHWEHPLATRAALAQFWSGLDQHPA